MKPKSWQSNRKLAGRAEAKPSKLLDAPRLLRPTAHAGGDYTDRPAKAMRLEPEAVSPATVERFAAAAQADIKQRVAIRLRRRKHQRARRVEALRQQALARREAKRYSDEAQSLSGRPPNTAVDARGKVSRTLGSFETSGVGWPD